MAATNQKKLKIKRNDTVLVTAGRERGKIGKVLRVVPADDTVIVEKVNMVRRQVKPQGDRAGGTIEKEAPLHVSNVALWNTAAGKRVKVRWERDAEKGRVRVDKKTGNPID